MTGLDALPPGASVRGRADGFADYLVGPAARRRLLTDRFIETFEAWGYGFMATPLIEPLDTIAAGVRWCPAVSPLPLHGLGRRAAGARRRTHGERGSRGRNPAARGAVSAASLLRGVGAAQPGAQCRTAAREPPGGVRAGRCEWARRPTRSASHSRRPRWSAAAWSTSRSMSVTRISFRDCSSSAGLDAAARDEVLAALARRDLVAVESALRRHRRGGRRTPPAACVSDAARRARDPRHRGRRTPRRAPASRAAGPRPALGSARCACHHRPRAS